MGKQNDALTSLDLSIVLKIESLLINSVNGQNTFAPELHQILEKYYIDIDRLKNTNRLAFRHHKAAFDESVKTVTNVRTIADTEQYC